MKKPVQFFLLTLSMGLTTLFTVLQGAPCGGPTVLWHNLSDGVGGFSPGVVNSVTDQNIDVIGTNALVNGIAVSAIACDITISVTNGDAVITGSGNRSDGVLTNPARLYLFAAPGRQINFVMQDDLLFRGTANGSTLLDLLVTVSGGGNVNFTIDGGQSVTFGSLPTTGGTRLFVAMQNPQSSTLLFRRSLVSPNSIVQVEVGQRSCISYMAATAVSSGLANETATIAFDPNNSGLGCFILRLATNSCFDIAGHQFTGSLANPNFGLSDINLTVPAGLNAVMDVRNANSASGVPSLLTVVNTNNVLTNYVQDPFCDGAFAVTGTQTGFILGANATLQLNDITYLNYIGATINQVPTVFTPLSAVTQEVFYKILNGLANSPQDFIKQRNPSAFVVDGNQNVNAVPAAINMLGSSAIYFRSGCDNLGSYTESFVDGNQVVLSFTINRALTTEGVGNIVFDVEGLLNVNGQVDGNNALNVLSLAVSKTGCSVFPETDETQFPQRTFARGVDGDYLRYNNGGFLINNRINFNNASLLHTDQNHIVLERDNLGVCDLNSEPTYIGGETFVLCLPEGQQRPTIALFDSIMRFATGAGFTGVDIRTPNNQNGNVSTLRFYGNGRLIDNGYGRYVILGTNEGSLSADGQLISADAHLDVVQENAQNAISIHELALDVSSNTSCITEGIIGNIANQFSVHTLFLGNNTNISIGTDGTVGTNSQGQQFSLITTPSLIIDGDYFSFETHGGSRGLPETSGTTGQGGIFVDQNGTITIDRLAIANFSTMVVRSGNGVIDLPENQVNFRNRVGITQWNINLTQANQRILIPSTAQVSDFTMDWGAVTKDYTSTNSFVPYEPVFTPSACFCPPVTQANLRALPVVQGTVNQFQIKRSRIGDQAHLLVDGGNIRELVFLLGCNTAEAPVGFIVVQNNGRVGINTAHRNLDSDSAQIVLGINGVTLCANGTGAIELNENVIINNVCHIVPGPAFGANGPQTLTIYSEDPKELRILSTGVLDLSQFTNPNQIIQFGGNLQLVFEPGSSIILGGGTIVFTDNTNISLERVINSTLFAGATVSDLDPIRVKMVGSGTVIMNEASQFLIHADTFFGIETDPTCTNLTDISWVLNDNARFEVGNDNEPGGVFQVGNTITTTGATINFDLTIDGIGATFQINRQGMVGFGVGVANRSSIFPNNWLLGCLANVGDITISLNEGIFRHNQIYPGNNDLASLLAIGPARSYSLDFDPVISNILGGGNMILAQNCLNASGAFVSFDLGQTEELVAQLVESNQSGMIRIEELRPLITQLIELLNAPVLSDADRCMIEERSKELISTCMMHRGALSADDHLDQSVESIVRAFRAPALGVMFNPTVTAYSGAINSSLSVGIFSSRDLLNDNSQPPQPSLVTPAAFFNYLVTRSHPTYLSPKANCAQTDLNVFTLGYVSGSVINRLPFTYLLGGVSADPVPFTSSIERGAVYLNLQDGTNIINNVIQILGS